MNATYYKRNLTRLLMLQVEMEDVAYSKKKSFDYSNLGPDDLFFHKLGKVAEVWRRAYLE